MRILTTCLGIGLFLGATLAATVDPYDVQDASDNKPQTTTNELMHGSDQWHDLAAIRGTEADEDWYRFSQKPFSSYEVVVEGISGDVAGAAFAVQRIDSNGSTVLQSAALTGPVNRSLRFVNATAAAVNNQYIVVKSAACGIACGTDDVYRIRASETTASVSRFNNTGSQVTVLLLQNPADYTIAGTVYFWNASGAAVATAPFSLAAKAQFVLPTQTVTSGTSGHLTIAHNGRYGDLGGKGMALEPATGFSFDTPLEHRPR